MHTPEESAFITACKRDFQAFQDDNPGELTDIGVLFAKQFLSSNASDRAVVTLGDAANTWVRKGVPEAEEAVALDRKGKPKASTAAKATRGAVSSKS